MPDFSEVALRLIDIGRLFYGRGWALGTSGNFSAVTGRDPLRLAITASTVDKGELTLDDIVEVDETGRLVSASPAGRKPSSETLLHIELVRARGAGAVFHTHSIWSTLLSDVFARDGGFYIAGYEMLKGLDGIHTHEHREWVPVLENDQDIERLGRRGRQLVTEYPAIHGFLLRRHGFYTWGATIPEARRHVEIFEFLLEALWRSYAFPKKTEP